jgi:hypothetical protein
MLVIGRPLRGIYRKFAALTRTVFWDVTLYILVGRHRHFRLFAACKKR